RDLSSAEILQDQYSLLGRQTAVYCLGRWTAPSAMRTDMPLRTCCWRNSILHSLHSIKNLTDPKLLSGSAQFGRRWTKIAKLIGTRTVLQAKSYARQCFKNKV
ncbi:hypothetical protein cypCar_00019816, partial [Cyprinus carpio]